MEELSTQGIWLDKDAQDERFVRFHSIIQRSARALGRVLFDSSGEGLDMVK